MSFPLGEVRDPFGLARMFARLTAPRMAPGPVVRVHRRIYLLTGGRIGHGVFGAPILLLHTVGRRSGLRRSTPLVYGADGGTLVVVASNGGRRAPGWLANLRANPEAEVWIARYKAKGRARVIEPGDVGYERLWELMDEVNFGRYEHLKTSVGVPMPIVVISPLPDTP
ncbi:MAG: nitroreductase family deazaflavin-dependent oxidoreductase [Streptosporangiales bacterium]|nr:nitroreductase family deazaflavin-dependent oxidoreductase [Streptosporangiales bacterium]